MDKNQFAIFASALRTYYPREAILPNNEAMTLWYQELQDIPYESAIACLRKWVNLSKWSPSIADIREMCAELASGEPKTWQDGWDTVLTAVRKYGYLEPDKATRYLEATDPIAADCVLKMGWRNICLSENQIADRAAFRGCYEILAKREQERRQMSPALLEMIKGIQIAGMDDARRLIGREGG